MALPTGKRLGQYEILSAIGAGGMGEVYRARDTRSVATSPSKFCRDCLRLTNPHWRASSAKRRSSPRSRIRICWPFTTSVFTMVPRTLSWSCWKADRSASGSWQATERALPLRKVLDYGIQIAKGLAAAHGKQIVHRDLKPENVFLTTDGRLKILDFGLARLPEAVASDGVTVAPATNPGTVMGTVGYMAPEQVRGEPVDHLTDVFAFGCVLHEMAAGRRAFERPTTAETMTAILHDDPPSVAGAAELLAPLQSIISRCLEKQREERFHPRAIPRFIWNRHAKRPARRTRCPGASSPAPNDALRVRLPRARHRCRRLAGPRPRRHATGEECHARGVVQLTDLPGIGAMARLIT